MGKLKKIARRTFLIGSATIAGGVLFGVYAVKRPHANPLLKDLSEDEASFSPWVKISSASGNRQSFLMRDHFMVVV